MRRLIFITLFGLSIIGYGCKGCCDKNIDGIHIEDIIIYEADTKYDVDYDDLVEKSLHKDMSSINKLSLLEYNDGYSYDHGLILIEIVDRIGEDIFIKSIEDISAKQKAKVLSYFEAGVDMKNSKKNDWAKRVEDYYPKIYNFLANQ
ncbi:MAG: hypothetical protein J5523_03530 [Muribaculaceae bacterium]|nr:hypothetical protein [Muribaculaceae bacterium]